MVKVYIPDTMLRCETEVLFLNLGYKVVENPYKADIIVFTGGEDISPAIYCQKKCPYTYSNLRRDNMEIDLYNEFNNKLFVGICRGAQLLAALKGGELVQHIDSPHKSQHEVCYNDEKVMVNSLHHQAIIINKNMKVIMAQDEKLKGIIYPMDLGRMVEDFFYCVDMFTQENAFCVQFHPELMNVNSRAVKLFNKELKNFIKERKNKCAG